MPSLTSLVKTPAHQLATCTYCGSHRVTNVSMTLADGSLVDFASCHRCEGKRWSHGGGALPLATVLNRARKQS